MRAALCIAAVILAGCGVSPQNQKFAEIAAECFADAAYEATRAELLFRVAAPCCKKCVNGKVRSGDGQAWVDCPCDPGCDCKSRPAGEAVIIESGTCPDDKCKVLLR